MTTLTLLIAIAAAASTGFSSTPKNGYSSAHGDRDQHDVVGERPEQPLLDDADRLARQGDRRHDAAQVGADQRDVGGSHGHVGARADGDAQVGLSQRRRIVDAVAHHRHDLALGLQLP